MSRRRARGVLAAALLAAGLLLPGGTEAVAEPALRVDLTPGPFTVGDRITATLEVAGPPAEFAGEPVFPVWEERWGEAEVLAFEPPRRLPADSEDAAVRFIQRVELTVFRTGEVALPPVTVRVPAAGGELTLTSPSELTIPVESVLTGEAGEQPQLRPPEPPRALPWGMRFWITAALLATACTALLVALALRRPRPQKAAPTVPQRPALPPFEELRRAIAAARQGDSVRGAHAAISLALRRYLGRALDFSALESSTTEVRRRLALYSLPAAASRRTVAILTDCDLVKFARRPASPDDLTHRADGALAAAAEIEAQLAALAARATPPAGAEAAA